MEKIKKYQLEIIVFICEAMTMVIELIAARVLSPYVGSSNLIWTSIIGVMLISMSIGYWAGGKIADKKQDLKDLSEFILIASITTSLIPILETIIVNELAEIIPQKLIVVAIISAIILFGIPSFMLATVSPIAVKLKNNQQNKVGTVSGKISSLSTIGSIFGTFLAGFVLIPNIGVNNIILGSSIILFLLSIIIYPNKNLKYLIRMIITFLLIIGIFALGRYLFKKDHPDIIKDVDSEYSRIWVKKVTTSDANYKTLQVDQGLESYINEETGEMGAKYLTFYDLFEYYNKNANKTLIIGGAAYTYPKHYLSKYEDKTIDVIEIDEKMTEIAQEEFDLDVNNKNLRIFHQDGRSYLNYSNEKYDTILIDAFKGLNAPFELTTYEAMCKAKERLNDNGLVITNIISSLEGKDSKFIKHEYATYKEVFDDVKLFYVQKIDNQDMQNLILVGIKGKLETNIEKQEEYKNMLDLEITDFESNESMVTDDFAPIGN